MLDFLIRIPAPAYGVAIVLSLYVINKILPHRR